MVKDIIEPIADLIGKFIPDPNRKAELLAELQKHPHVERLEQMRVNAEEAKHSSIFVAGWRPFVGWVGGVSLAYTVIIWPTMSAVFSAFGIELPRIPYEIIVPILGGMLGISIPSRSWEKVNGVARSNMGEFPREKPL